MDLVFARELSFYIVTIYIPCFMIVVVSWFSFWLDYKAVSLSLPSIKTFPRQTVSEHSQQFPWPNSVSNSFVHQIRSNNSIRALQGWLYF